MNKIIDLMDKEQLKNAYIVALRDTELQKEKRQKQMEEQRLKTQKLVNENIKLKDKIAELQIDNNDLQKDCLRFKNESILYLNKKIKFEKALSRIAKAENCICKNDVGKWVGCKKYCENKYCASCVANEALN